MTSRNFRNKWEADSMMHMAYPATGKLEVGTHVTIVGTPVIAGDVLAIEYPDNSRGKGMVVQCSVNILQIDVDGECLRLAPLSPREAVDAPFKFASKETIVWIVQP